MTREELKAECAEAYKHIRSTRAVARRFGLSQGTVARLLKENDPQWALNAGRSRKRIATPLVCETCGKPRSFGSASQCRDCYTGPKIPPEEIEQTHRDLLEAFKQGFVNPKGFTEEEAIAGVVKVQEIREVEAIMRANPDVFIEVEPGLFTLASGKFDLKEP